MRSTGGKSSRISKKLHDAIEKINLKREKKHGKRGILSTEMATHLIASHKGSFNEICHDIVNTPLQTIKEKRKDLE